MLKFRYIGPIDVIETVLDGRVHRVARGDIIEVTPHTAEMLALVPTNWEPADARAKKSAAAATADGSDEAPATEASDDPGGN